MKNRKKKNRNRSSTRMGYCPTDMPDEYIEPWWAPECPSEPKAIPSSRASGVWDIKDEWYGVLISIPGIIKAVLTPGHLPEEGVPYPSIKLIFDDVKVSITNMAVTAQRIFHDIASAEGYEGEERSEYPGKAHILICCRLPRIWMSECQVDAWWDEVLARLKAWVPNLTSSEPVHSQLLDGPYSICRVMGEWGLIEFISNIPSGFVAGIGVSIGQNPTVQCYEGSFTDAIDLLKANMAEKKVSEKIEIIHNLSSKEMVDYILPDYVLPHLHPSQLENTRKALVYRLLNCFGNIET